MDVYKTLNGKRTWFTDSYLEGRKSLDSLLSSFIGFVKATVRDGVTGITTAAEETIKKEEEEKKKNDTEEAVGDQDEKKNEVNM